MNKNYPTNSAPQGLQEGATNPQQQKNQPEVTAGFQPSANTHSGQANSSGAIQNPIQGVDKQDVRANSAGSSNSGTGGTVSDSLSETVVEGGLSKKTFGRILQSKRERLLTCYNKELLNNPDAQGLVLTKIDINHTGKVDGVSVLQSDLGDIKFENCIVSEIKRWKFPAPRGGRVVRVSHPFRFSP